MISEIHNLQVKLSTNINQVKNANDTEIKSVRQDLMNQVKREMNQKLQEEEAIQD